MLNTRAYAPDAYRDLADALGASLYRRKLKPIVTAEPVDDAEIDALLAELDDAPGGDPETSESGLQICGDSAEAHPGLDRPDLQICGDSVAETASADVAKPASARSEPISGASEPHSKRIKTPDRVSRANAERRCVTDPLREPSKDTNTETQKTTHEASLSGDEGTLANASLPSPSLSHALPAARSGRAAGEDDRSAVGAVPVEDELPDNEAAFASSFVPLHLLPRHEVLEGFNHPSHFPAATFLRGVTLRDVPFSASREAQAKIVDELIFDCKQTDLTFDSHSAFTFQKIQSHANKLAELENECHQCNISVRHNLKSFSKVTQIMSNPATDSRTLDSRAKEKISKAKFPDWERAHPSQRALYGNLAMNYAMSLYKFHLSPKASVIEDLVKAGAAAGSSRVKCVKRGLSESLLNKLKRYMSPDDIYLMFVVEAIEKKKDDFTHKTIGIEGAAAPHAHGLVILPEMFADEIIAEFRNVAHGRRKTPRRTSARRSDKSETKRSALVMEAFSPENPEYFSYYLSHGFGDHDYEKSELYMSQAVTTAGRALYEADRQRFMDYNLGKHSQNVSAN